MKQYLLTYIHSGIDGWATGAITIQAPDDELARTLAKRAFHRIEKSMGQSSFHEFFNLTDDCPVNLKLEH